MLKRMIATAFKKRAALHTLGCRLNQAETTLLADRLRADGYEIVPFGFPADLAVINTCTVTREADAKSRKLVRQFVRENPEAYLAVIGCYAQMGASSIAAIPGVDLILGSQEKLNVLDYVKLGKNPQPLIVRERIDREDFEINISPELQPLTQRANLKIQDGCDFMCSFCIIPFARGRARSRALPNLREEAELLVRRGARELVLTGVNIGTYGWRGAGIVDVIDTVNEIPGLDRIRISSIEPTTIPESLFPRMAARDHKLAPYLHVPVQSGSNAILSRMRRRYSREEYLEFLFRAHDAVPDIGLGTDILTGFPGETENDFEGTCDLLWRSPLFYAHVFKYSEREGTASARMSGRLSPETISARAAHLRRLSAQKLRMFQEYHLGKEVEVLAETREGDFWTGYTGNYLRVACASREDLANQMLWVVPQRIEQELLMAGPR